MHAELTRVKTTFKKQKNVKPWTSMKVHKHVLAYQSWVQMSWNHGKRVSKVCETVPCNWGEKLCNWGVFWACEYFSYIETIFGNTPQPMNERSRWVRSRENFGAQKYIQTVPLISQFCFYINRQHLKHTQFESEVRIAIVALAILTGYVALCHAAAATADTPHPEVVLTRDNS